LNRKVLLRGYSLAIRLRRLVSYECHPREAKGMTEALLLVVVGSLVPISVATLVFAVLTLRKAHMYVELVERQLENLREGQIVLLTLLREQSRSPHEEPHSLEDRVRQERHRLALAVRARRETGRATDAPAPDLRNVSAWSGVRSSPGEEPPADEDAPPKVQSAEIRPRAANFPDTTSSRAAKAIPEGEAPRRAIWHPHPDDDVSPAGASEPGQATVEMFRRHYDKYLDNYEGYVKLAERLFRMRDEAGNDPGPLAERQWEERLRRVADGIQRTTARLDILEEYNPELATDDRVSRRAAIASHHRDLDMKRWER
jgi:hypothetical protein